MGSNILIVEDHELTRFGLKTAFETCDYVETIYEAESAEDCLEIIKKNNVDLVVMDLGLPGMNGIEATKNVKQFNQEIKVVILTSHNDTQEVLNSLKAGANAYCSKEINPKRLTQVVSSVLDGASWFDPSIAHIVLEAASKSEQIKPIESLSLKSEVVDVHKINKGDNVGYGTENIVNEDGYIAVLPVGIIFLIRARG